MGIKGHVPWVKILNQTILMWFDIEKLTQNLESGV